MAAVVESPLDREKYLPDALANTLEFHSAFVRPSAASTGTGSPASNFVLNKATFANLKVYLEQVAKFPDTWGRFERDYPKEVFKRWTEEQRIGLYDDLKESLVAVRSHCNDFQNKILPKMNNLSGNIANFADQNASSIKVIKEGMVIVADPDKVKTDPDVEKAIDDVWEACVQIINGTKTTIAECGLMQTDFETFKSQTTKDKDVLTRLNKESDAAWPSREKLAQDLRKNADKAYNDLKPMFDEQLSYSKKPDGAKSFTNSIGAELYYENDDQLKRLKKLDATFQSVWNTRRTDYQLAMVFQERSKVLESNIDSVRDSIDNAITALKDLAAAFGTFVVEMTAIKNKIDDVKPYITDDSARRRAKANNRFAEANTKWLTVKEAAQFFQKNGIELSEDLKKKVQQMDTKPAPTPRLEIEGADFGSLNVTAYAAPLWHMETYLSICGTSRAFSDPWPTIEKTLSCLYRWGNERRILVCMEYTDQDKFYRIEEGDKSKSDTGKAYHQVCYFSQAPSTSKVQIVAVTWGLKAITDTGVWNRLYDKVNQDVSFNNDTFGEDTWKGRLKSGTIYYIVKGGDGKVQQISGKEGKSVYWRA